MELSIIIVNWNTCDLLVRCLEAIYQYAGSLTLEIIVVDNASTDNSLEVIRRQFPQVIVVENHENTGFSRANNQGITMAKGRYYLLLNSDAFVHQGTLETMVQFMDRHPQAGAAGCRLYYEDGRFQPSCTSFPTLATELWQVLWLDRVFPSSPIFGKYRMSYCSFEGNCEVDSIMGAFMFLRREAIDQAGLMDESYFMYSEEVDLCYRLKQAGWKVMYTPEASATHIWGGTSRRIEAETTFLRLYRSRMLFFRKHYGRLSALAYKLVLSWGSTIRVVGGLAHFLMRKNRDTLAITRNYWALLRSLRAF